jgi:hypothetical protein
MIEQLSVNGDQLPVCYRLPVISGASLIVNGKYTVNGKRLTVNGTGGAYG